ncbi:MAG: hypothetical protein K2Y71_26420 [Xanthobacteraceae bacterium]|nr:hypothetical protein [Xanthobacteraceae bacterium]
MATFRMTASAGAVLIAAFTAVVPATAQAQGPGAPLELAPGPNQARPATRAAIRNKDAAKPAAKAPAKAITTNTTARAAPRQNTAAAQPAPKAARVNSRTAAGSLARHQQLTGPHAPLARYAHPQPVIRAAVVPYLAVSRPVFRRGTRDAPIVARSPAADAPQDRVMRGRDTVSLVAMLPWWRNNRMQDVNYGSEAAESKVIEAAAVWLAANEGETAGEPDARDVMAAPVEEAIEVAESGTINDIDLAAHPDSGIPTPTFLQSLLALIGGAAAAAAASARLLFS